MSKMAPSYGMPLDQPVQVYPGVSDVERDFQGNGSKGFVHSMGETPDGHAKGDIGDSSREAPRPLTGPVPFINLRGGH